MACLQLRRTARLWVVMAGLVGGSTPAAAGVVPVRSQASRWRLSAQPPCPSGWAGDRPRRRARARCAERELPPARDRATRNRPPAPDPRPERGREFSKVSAVHRPPRRTHDLDADTIVQLDRRRCEQELDHAGVDYRPLDPEAAPSVAQPIRLTGPMSGVTFRLAWSKTPETDRHAIWDCRLAVAMVPLAAWLSAQGVHTVEYFSVLRRGSSGQDRPRSLHSVGLAIDVLAFHHGEERTNVADAYPRGHVANCSNSRGQAPSEGGDIWVGMVCAAVERRGVHTLLTPDHDRAHRDHLHLDLKSWARVGADPYVSFAEP